MKVFISWSGKDTKSHAVAMALDEWLPTVLNAAEPWVSTRGLTAGLQWNQQLDRELDDTHFGIIVVTPWNQHSQWLNFEAGALSKRVSGAETRVAPLLIDFPNMANLKGPLSSYQAVMPSKEGINELVVSINGAMGEEARGYKALNRSFEVCWPAFAKALEEIEKNYPEESDPSKVPNPQPKAVDDTDMLSEILSAVRSLSRTDARLTTAISESSKRSSTAEQIKTNSSRTTSHVLMRYLRAAGLPVSTIRMEGSKAVVLVHEAVPGPLVEGMTSELDLGSLGLKEITFVVANDEIERPFFQMFRGGLTIAG